MTWNKHFKSKLLVVLAVFLFILILTTTLFRTFAWAADPATAPLTLSNIKAQLIGNGSIVISWQTNKPADSRVTYSDDLSFSQNKTLSTLYLDRAIVLDNIKPDTLYHYRVISRTPQGEEATSAHLLIESHRPIDLAIGNLQIDPSVRLFVHQPPVLDEGVFTATIRNNGDIDETNDFLTSILISADETAISSETDRYSCFLQKNITGGFRAQEEKTISLTVHDMATCDPLGTGPYQLTVAVDYDNELSEANRDNNVATSSLPITDSLMPQFSDLESNDLTATSTTLSASLDRHDPSTRVTIEYTSDPYYSAEQTQGTYQFHQDAIFSDGIYLANLQGLQQETTYHYRFHLANTNVVSDDQTFTTKKDLQSDEEYLIGLKRNDPSCRRVDSQPLNISYWQDLSLTLPASQPILRYRILWGTGGWSPWYVPGSGDEDWQMNSQGQERRVWSYFQDHSFQYEICGNQNLPSENKQSTQPIEEKYDVTIDRVQEAKSPSLEYKISAVSKALKYYKRAVSTDNWQVLQDAYVYGGYSLGEITDSIITGAGTVHPTIPANIWRLQSQVRLSSH